MTKNMTQAEKIVAFMKDEAYKPLLFNELLTVLDVPKNEIEAFSNVLTDLENEGFIIKTKKGRYGATSRMGLIVGQYQGHEKGFGFVIPDDKNIKDLFIPPDFSKNALHNDRVIARVTHIDSITKKSEGEIVRIIKRANEKVVGTFEKNRNFGFVVPDEKRISKDIFISNNDTNKAKDGQKVVVLITNYGDSRRNPEGEVIEILGYATDVGTDIVSIIKKFHLSEEFPNEVLNEAEKISDTISEKEIEGRLDLRNQRIVTIDGEDAKDLDDAVCVLRLSNGNYKLGVHIADVSHYVTNNSLLDKEAYKRGTSVYLVDRVLPMLPKKLSNGICSLNPKVDRLTLSCIMEINQEGKVVNYEIKKSVINSCERMTYTNVTRLLENEEAEDLKKYDYIKDEFFLMKELALILKKRRQERGSIDFNFPEPKIILDELGKPIEVKKYEVTISNNIIEEFMLICNETIAEHMFWQNSPFVYRVHQNPDEEKLQNFTRLISSLGYHMKGISKVHPKALQEILNKCKGTKEEKIISTVMLRSLMKAEYSHENLGHFGLAAKYYCHFTSPIRRYPDLAIHRIISKWLNGEIDSKTENNLRTFVREAAIQSSKCELVAVEAERETDDLKKTEYMADKIGQKFYGIISSVTSFGFFVELENTIEGLVRISSLEDDYYIYDEDHFQLIGEHTKKIYKIGDEVSVMLVRANVHDRKIDFILV